MRSRLALSVLLVTTVAFRCDAAWDWIKFGMGGRPVSQTAVSCWLTDAQGDLLFLLLLRGNRGWYSTETTNDFDSSDAGFKWKWRVGKIAYTIDYRAAPQQLRVFGQSVSLSGANVIAVEQTDSSKPQLRGIARVNVRVSKDADAVQLVESRSPAVRAWISAK